MIKEEQWICQKQKQSVFNHRLSDELEKVKNEYELSFNKAHPSEKDDLLSNIYKLISSVSQLPMVKQQMNAIKIYQEHFIKLNERDTDIQTTGL